MERMGKGQHHHLKLYCMFRFRSPFGFAISGACQASWSTIAPKKNDGNGPEFHSPTGSYCFTNRASIYIYVYIKNTCIYIYVYIYVYIYIYTHIYLIYIYICIHTCDIIIYHDHIIVWYNIIWYDMIWYQKP